MGDHTELMEKRDQLRREIAAGRDKTLPARIFNTTGRMIGMITRRRQLVSWIYCASILALIILLSELLVVGLFDVTPVWSLIWIASLEQGFIAMILAHIFMDNRLPDMLYHLTDVIQSVDDLVDLRRWLADVWSVRRCLAFVMLFSVTWCLFSATIGSSLYPSELAGLGPVLGILGALAYGIVIGIAIYYVLEFLRLPARIGRYRFGLYEFAPINSEIIGHLSRTFNYVAFVISVVAAVGTLIVALMRTPVLSVGVILSSFQNCSLTLP